MRDVLWWIGYACVLAAFIGGAVNRRSLMWLGLLGGVIAWATILLAR